MIWLLLCRVFWEAVLWGLQDMLACFVWVDDNFGTSVVGECLLQGSVWCGG